MRSLVADLEDEHRIVAHVRRRFGDDLPDQVHAVGAAGERERRLGAVLGRQRRHARVVDVRRVAEDEVVAAGQLREQVGLDHRDPLVEMVARDVDARDLERIG